MQTVCYGSVPPTSASSSFPVGPFPMIVPSARTSAQTCVSVPLTQEQALTRYYESVLTEKADQQKVELPQQALHFVLFSVLVLALGWLISWAITRQQVESCKRAYGSALARDIPHESLLAHIRGYLYAS